MILILLAPESGVAIYVTDGAVRRVEPDDHGRLVADIDEQSELGEFGS